MDASHRIDADHGALLASMGDLSAAIIEGGGRVPMALWALLDLSRATQLVGVFQMEMNRFADNRNGHISILNISFISKTSVTAECT
jgi:hypothetical protein